MSQRATSALQLLQKKQQQKIKEEKEEEAAELVQTYVSNENNVSYLRTTRRKNQLQSV